MDKFGWLHFLGDQYKGGVHKGVKMQSRQNLIPVSRYLSLTIPTSQPNKNRKSRSRSLSKLPLLTPYFQLASRVLPQKIAKSRIPPKPIADPLLSSDERLTCSKPRHCRAQPLYGVFPGLLGQGISVAYPRQNQLGPRNPKRIGRAD